MDLDPSSNMFVPKCNGCISLKILKMRSSQVITPNPVMSELVFEYKNNGVIDTVKKHTDTIKKNAKIHLKSVVGSLSGFMSQLVSRPKEDPSMAARAQLRRLREWSETSVSIKTHEKLLRRLWNVLVPDSSFKTKSSKWMDIGFQNSNPISDFRGGGELALRALVYVAESHSKFMCHVVSSHKKTRSYPACVGAINIVLMVCNILRLSEDRVSPEYFWSLFEDPKAFFVIFFVSFRLLEKTWNQEQGTLTEFSKIMSSVEKHVRDVLNSGPSSLSSFERKLR
jgi:hypothetical protein